MSRTVLRGTAALAVLLLLLWLAFHEGGNDPAPPDTPAGSGGVEVVDAPPVVPVVNGRAADDPGAAPARTAPIPGPGLTVSGVVIHQNGVTPAGGVALTLTHQGRTRYGESAKDGTFRFTNVAGGEVRIQAKPRGATADAGARRSVTAKAGDTGVRIVLAPRGRIRLTIVDATTGETVRARLRIIEITKDGEQERASSSGGWTPGAGRLHLFPGRPLRLRVEADGYRPSDTIEGEYHADDPLQDVTVRMQPDPHSIAVLTLVVRDASGRHLDAANVTRHQDGGYDRSGYELHQGALELTLAPGEHDLEVGYGPTLAPVRFRLRLEYGERRTKEVTLVPGGTIWIPDEPEAVDDFVYLRRDGVRWWIRGKKEQRDGKDGRLFGPLAAGRWRLEPDGDPEFVPVEVELKAGETTVVRLELVTEDEED